MKKFSIRALSLIITIIITASFFTGCKEKVKPVMENGKFIIENIDNVVSSEMKQINGRSVIYHKGKPYLYYAMHHRYDHLYKFVDDAAAKKIFEEGAKKLKESGFDTMVVYLGWGRIYDGEKYDFSDLEYQYSIAKKYDLKIHINWFGYDVCGWGGYTSWQTDHEKYPPLHGMDGAPLLADDGSEIPDLSEQIFLDEAYESIQQVCAWLAVNDTDRRTVAIQLENEPDHNEGGMGNFLSQYKNVANLINHLGKAVKESNYSMVTYVNLMGGGRMDTLDGKDLKARVHDLIDKEYIDFVGWDAYTTDANIRVKDMEYGDNLPTWVEFGPCSYSVPGQINYSFSNGYGIGFYQLINFPDKNNNDGFFRCPDDNNLFVERDGTQIIPKTPSTIHDMGNSLELNAQDIYNINKAIKAIKDLIATQKVSNIVCFNNKMKNDDDTLKICNGEKITYHYKDTSKQYGGSGLCIGAADNNFYLYTTLDAKYEFTSEIKEVTTGTYNDGKWTVNDTVVIQGKTFEVKPGMAYRVVLK